MPNPIIRSRTTGSLAAALVVTCALTAPALADEVRPELDTPSQIAALVLALADTHRQPLHIFGLTAERTSQAEAVLQGRSFEADCRTLSLTAGRSVFSCRPRHPAPGFTSTAKLSVPGAT